jgi:hypothetical protein
MALVLTVRLAGVPEMRARKGPGESKRKGKKQRAAATEDYEVEIERNPGKFTTPHLAGTSISLRYLFHAARPPAHCTEIRCGGRTLPSP